MEALNLHAETVGSLLRPPELLRAREKRASGRMTAAGFKRIEDRAVDQAIGLQEAAGLEVVTDGEMRRFSFQSQLVEAVKGFGEYDIDSFLWGDWYGGQGVGNLRIERPDRIGVVHKLKRERYLSTEEFVYLNTHTSRIPKISLPSPSLWANFWSQKLSESAYPKIEDFLADVVDILRDEVAHLAGLGAKYIQIDAPHYALLLEPATRVFYERQGWTAEQWLARGIEMDNAVMGDFPDVTFGFHL